ncbi:hypothetical protein DFH06DRAFT_264105 [Mycena polygramma]|nr:hypothetical protein DFH06DRAFT_264105 [Mycena polygramma]
MLAEGDVDPVTLLPMTDINPRYVPRVLKPLAFVVNGARNDKGKKGKAGGILNFFDKVPARAKAASPKAAQRTMVVGKASGKRSLAAEMDRDIAAKRKKYEDTATQSRFFPAPQASTSRVGSDTRLNESKENVPLVDEDDDLMETDLDADLEWDSLSLVALPERDGGTQMMDVEEPEDNVEQEDGYISPTPSRSGEAEDFSSPLRPGVTPPPRKRVKIERPIASERDFEVDAVSSPPEEARTGFGRPMRLAALELCRSHSRSPTGAVLVAASPDPPRTVLVGPDLRDAFDDQRTSDIDCFEEDDADTPGASGSTPTPSPSPLTPDDDVSGDLALALVDPEEMEAHANAVRSEVVAAGWRDRWGHSNTKGKGRATPTLRRRETNVTPAGRHLPINGHLRPHPYLQHDAPSSVPSKHPGGKLQSRRSLTFLDPVRPKPARGRASDILVTGDDRDDAVARAHIRLAQYRCP